VLSCNGVSKKLNALPSSTKAVRVYVEFDAGITGLGMVSEVVVSYPYSDA